ncbi:uncharacterized protein BCR38DRAFT_319796, partial [Pseudomassariella vexata]
ITGSLTPPTDEDDPLILRADNQVVTPTPTQPGMVTSCDQFYSVVPSDTCLEIAGHHDISLEQFYDWNQGVGQNCESLLAGDYVCV